MTTPVLFSAKQKELASLKQLFVFNAPKTTSASRQKSEANLGCNIASLVAVRGVKVRHVVEKRKENRVDFREEQKAV
ncbi:MAG: hypothetical protein IJW56_01710 [Bacteroides sp.]|nr:hypothetical protein [Bacteroides sp.]